MVYGIGLTSGLTTRVTLSNTLSLLSLKITVTLLMLDPAIVTLMTVVGEAGVTVILGSG